MNVKFPFWQGLLKLLTDMGDGTHAERVEAYPPKVLMTDGNGTYARMRVDVGQTGFFAGREARTFHEFAIPTGQSQIIKVGEFVKASGFLAKRSLKSTQLVMHINTLDAI